MNIYIVVHKITDKLHYNQLITIPAIKQLINADIQVIKLKNAKIV
jgi:hypothetical protein